VPSRVQTPRRQRHGKKVAAKAVRAKRVGAAAAQREAVSGSSRVIAYHSAKGVDDYVRQVARATPLQLVEIERQGVLGSFIKDLSRRMEIPSSRIFAILGVPKATAEKKAAAGERVEGRGGQAAIGMVRLLGIAQEIAANSTASEAKTFDATKWLGQWIERPQAALGGRKPADLLDTPTGVEMVARLLGSVESGAYQ
jgi:putative toxin-antitoxin system antitoxin component (TIGR02293 family)